uniref:DUF459 domain-containing protein n=1 Tax=Photorhabdus sp. RM322S TaxID=3342825 RepID=UPI0036D9287B
MNIFKLSIISAIFFSTTSYSRPIFIGDSLGYEIAKSYSSMKPMDARYKVGSGLESNKLLNWQNYAEQFNFESYDTVFIILGTNDHIRKSDSLRYISKARNFIQAIKTKNQNIVWFLPPALKDVDKNNLLNNTRQSIIQAAQLEGIKILDIRKVLGDNYNEALNGIQIRTTDGIHITPNGAQLTVSQLLLKQ